ncbi:hypothetical protein [Kineococcus glutinatus]|uniref:GH26 domain-containing protein n=1 Tax=Kineococcus glutinatus TaxID=1070872 RepID=A0ABP9HER4_9ACTN
MQSPHSRPTATARRLTLAVATALAAALTCPTLASASSPTPTATSSASQEGWLSFTVSGEDAGTRIYSSGVPGGGRLVSYWQMPGQDSTASSHRLTFTIQEDVVLARAARLIDGTMVPAAGSDKAITTERTGSATTVTVVSDGTADELYLLPATAPAAAAAEDQGALNALWGKVLDLIGADSPGADGSGTGDSGSDEEPPSPAETGTPGPTASASPAQDDPEPDACSSDGAEPLEETSPAPSDDTADGGQAQDYAVSDGPSAAPTFSAQTRQQAAEASAQECDDQPADSPAAPVGVQRPDLAEGDWESGAAGDPEGIAALRKGQPAEIATTWANGGSNAITVPQLQDGGEYSKAAWNKSLIVSVSPFEAGGSWAKAARGEYDDEWRRQLTNIKTGWGGRDGNLYLSLAWELNGNWFPWAVTREETAAFHTAWARYRTLQRQILPQALLTLTFNRESNGYDGDARDLIPTGKIDAYGVDYYNHFPYAATAADFQSQLDDRDGGGGPKGFTAHRQAAAAAGVPVIVPEWDGSAKNGDSPDFMAGMYQQFRDNAGPSAGQVAAESLFEIDKDGGNWTLLSGTKMPQSAEAYARLWGQGTDSGTGVDL